MIKKDLPVFYWTYWYRNTCIDLVVMVYQLLCDTCCFNFGALICI